MHGRGYAKHDDESSTSGSAKNEVGNTRSTTVGADDACARNVWASDAQSDVSRPGIIAGMLPGPSAPTMRSRVTVVCAECKKQKLRCDRRIPCESCVKRNTVSRCIYTPAAIEKVDVTSINNRLRVVEGSLNALGLPTQGYQHQVATLQAQSPLYMHQMQSSAGPSLPMNGKGALLPGTQHVPPTVHPSMERIAQVPAQANDPGWNVPTPRILALTNDFCGASAAAPLDGATALWVHEILPEGIQGPSVFQSQQESQGSTLISSSERGKMVSSKSHSLDLHPIDREKISRIPALGSIGQSRMDAKQTLSLHAGLGVSSLSRPHHVRQAGTEVGCDPSADSGCSELITDMCAPLAAQLLTQFPSPRARREMLIRLGTANLSEGMSCVPFTAFCSRIESMCPSISDKGIGRVTSTIQSTVPAFSGIAESAAALAVGALMWAIEPPSDETSRSEALRRMVARTIEPLSATSIPQTPTSSFAHVSTSSLPRDGLDDTVDTEEGLERPTPTTAYALYRLARLALAMHTARHGHAARDVAFIHTQILNAHYLLLAHSSSAEWPDSNLPAELPPLVGALIWEARAMGLGVDPDEFDPVRHASNSSTTGLADSEHSSLSPVKCEEDATTSETGLERTRMSPFVKEVRRRLWWWVVWLDLFVSDAYGYNTTILPGEYTTRLPAHVDDSCFHADSTTLPVPDDSTPERNNGFYIIKLRSVKIQYLQLYHVFTSPFNLSSILSLHTRIYRLLEILKHAPARAIQSSLVPNAGQSDNATSAAAQGLADEIMHWLNELPERFKVDAADEDRVPTTGSKLSMGPLLHSPAEELEHDAARRLLNAQRYCIVVHAYHVLVRLFTTRLPFPLSPVRQRDAKYSWSSDKATSIDQQFSGLRVVEPALAVVHAAHMQMTQMPDPLIGTYNMCMFPRRVFDAAVVLAYTAIQQPLYTSPIVIDAVRTALSILSRVLRLNARRGGTDESQKTEAERVIETLLKRAEKAKLRNAPIMAGMKRKHDEIDSESDQFDAPFRFPFLGSGIVNAHPSPIRTIASIRVPSNGHGLTSSQRSGTVYSGPGSGTQEDDSHPRRSNTEMGHRERNVPAVSIRQRLRNRKDDRSDFDPSRATLPAADSGIRVPASDTAPLHQSHDFNQQASSAGPSISSSPSVFSTEMASASPVSSFPRFNLGDVSRPAYSMQGHALRESGFMAHDSESIGAMPLQQPASSSTPYQPGYGAHSSLENQMTYDVDSAYASNSAPLVNESGTIDSTQPWILPPRHDYGHASISASLPSSYPPAQQPFPHENHPSPWTAGNLPAPHWNTSSFTNWNNHAQ